MSAHVKVKEAFVARPRAAKAILRCQTLRVCPECYPHPLKLLDRRLLDARAPWVTSEHGEKCAMQCAACGAKMLWIGVVLADIATMPGFERHSFKCSSCPQTARRLAICRAKMALVEPLPPIAAAQTPASDFRTAPPATSSSQPNAVEKLHSTQIPEEQKTTDWRPAVEKLVLALKERAAETRTSAWAKAVEKLRARQAALTERAACGQAPGEDSKEAQRGGAHAARRLNALRPSPG